MDIIVIFDVTSDKVQSGATVDVIRKETWIDCELRIFKSAKIPNFIHEQKMNISLLRALIML
eukprot:scaffold6180_cov202-Chaetoceros_neogracile.AAC.2